jgi:ethanolamine ammonia-lyase large subunit
MSGYRTALSSRVYNFADLRTLLAKATPLRSGDQLAGIAAHTAEERVAAQMALADVPLKSFLAEPLIPYETDEITRLIFESHDAEAFSTISHLTVGEFRDWLLGNDVDGEMLTKIAPGLMPEQVAAVSKLMRQQDLVKVARKIRVISRFRTTVGLTGRLSTRLQPNHPADDPRAIAAQPLSMA